MSESNVKSENESIFNRRTAAIFNEWARQHAENPDNSTKILDEFGVPTENYGEVCAQHFERIAEELEAAGTIPTVQTIIMRKSKT